MQNRRTRAKELLNIISGLGPAIIKAGQALSSRPDLLPTEYLEELQKLQDRVPAFQNSYAYDVVREELGMPFDEVSQKCPRAGGGSRIKTTLGKGEKACCPRLLAVMQLT